MTIDKGADWGEVVVDRVGGVEPSGDLARDLGFPGRPDHPGRWRRLPIDRIDIRITLADGSFRQFSTLSWVVGGQKLRGECVVVASTAHVHDRRLFSRAHPNDGRLDWLAIGPAMRLRERMAFWRRTRTETHLPHPMVKAGAGTQFAHTFLRAIRVRSAEGESFSGVIEMHASIVPDATHTHIPAQ